MSLVKRHLESRARRTGVALTNRELPQEYEITHPTHTPDLHGTFAGQKVYMRNGKQHVRLTEGQARFYLDQAALQLVVSS
jgi:hypothetical protein